MPPSRDTLKAALSLRDVLPERLGAHFTRSFSNEGTATFKPADNFHCFQVNRAKGLTSNQFCFAKK